MTQSFKTFLSIALAAAAGGVLVFSSIGYVFAGHNGAVVDIESGECGQRTFTAAIEDPEGTHIVENMHLIVSVDGQTESVVIPTDGTEASISVGPFATSTEDVATTTIHWRVFGGGERDYDSPAWNGYGEEGFSADINAYADEVGGFDWTTSGPDDPNPFVTWHEIEAEVCQTDTDEDEGDTGDDENGDNGDTETEITKAECKKGGWEEFDFRNQGQCIRFVNTGQDSR